MIKENETRKTISELTIEERMAELEVTRDFLRQGVGQISGLKKTLAKKRRRFFLWISVSVVLLFLFFVALPLFSKIIYLRHEQYFEKVMQQVEQSLDNEQKYLLQQSIEVVEFGNIVNYIEKRDLLNLLSILTDEKENRSVGMILAVDKDGVALSRTRLISKRGDYVFQTSLVGSIVSKGEDVAVIEEAFSLPLIMVGGHPIMKDGKITGAIFSSHSLDNEYAVRFKEKYLNKGVHLAFYSEKEGIVGNSFKDDEIEKLLISNFNIGSDLFQNNGTGFKGEVSFNKKGYFLKNLAFPGLKESPGGVLIFIAHNHIYDNAIVAVLITLIFSLGLFIYLRFRKDFTKKNVFVLGISSLIIFLVAFLVNGFILNEKHLSLRDPAYVIYNSTLEFEPQYSFFDRAFQHRIAIKVLPGGEAINAARVVVNYDPEIIKVEDIITTNSFCQQELFPEKTIDNKNGQVIISCGLPSPGFVERSGMVAELLIQPLKMGAFSLVFGEETQVLADDGLGTNVLRTTTNGGYRIAASGEQIDIKRLLVFSSSHPNSERWYKRKDVHFSWQGAEGYEYSYLFNQVPNSILSKENVTTKNSIVFNVKNDGVYYFHVAPIKEGITGATFHYKAMADATPPLPTLIRASHTRIWTGEVVRFEFEGKDEMSGLQSNYYVKIAESKLFLPVGPQLYTPFLEAGTHIVTVRTFDNAGNFEDNSIEIDVQGEAFIDKFINIDLQSMFK